MQAKDVVIEKAPSNPPPKTFTLTLTADEMAQVVAILGFGNELAGGLYNAVNMALLNAGYPEGVSMLPDYRAEVEVEPEAGEIPRAGRYYEVGHIRVLKAVSRGIGR